MKSEGLVPLDMVMKGARIRGSTFYTVRESELAARTTETADARLIRAMVTDKCSLSALPETLEGLRHRSHQCKLVSPNL